MGSSINKVVGITLSDCDSQNGLELNFTNFLNSEVATRKHLLIPPCLVPALSQVSSPPPET